MQEMRPRGRGSGLPRGRLHDQLEMAVPEILYPADLGGTLALERGDG